METTMKRKTDTRNLVRAGILCALIIVMTFVPYTGYIYYGLVEITTLHIVVAVGAVLLGIVVLAGRRWVRPTAREWLLIVIYGVAWFGIRVNTYANSRAAFASLRGKPFPVYAIPLQAGISIGALLIIIAAIATPIAKTQKMREVWFYVMSGGAVLKIVTMEIARILL